MASADDAMSWRRGAQPSSGGGGSTGNDPKSGNANPYAAAEDQMDERLLAEFQAIPTDVKQYLRYFHQRFLERNVEELHVLYEETFKRLSDLYFSGSSWPSTAVVAPLVEYDEGFVLLYGELVYRFAYGRGQPPLKTRVEAWDNYCNLLNLFLDDEVTVDFQLPASWLWDIVDEFIYQFEVWCQYRGRVRDKDPEEIAYLRENDHLWNVNTVLQYLHALVNKSNVCSWLLNGNAPAPREEGANDGAVDMSTIPVYRYIGYFSVIGLLRMHCLLGDFRLALMVLQPIDFNLSTALFTHVTACHISMHYFLGVSYLMLRRYEDATRVFSSTLLQIGRIRQHHTRSYQYEQVNKRIDQMVTLLALSTVFQSSSLDDSVGGLVRDKLGEKVSRLRAGDEAVFAELFSHAGPKFVSPSTPNYDGQSDSTMDAAKLQLKLFMSEVRQQILLPQIRSYLKLYTSIELTKLATFMDTDVETFRSYLHCLKYKSLSLVGSAMAPPHSGEYHTRADPSFFIDGDVVRISDSKAETGYGEYFIKEIPRLESTVINLNHAMAAEHSRYTQRAPRSGARTM